MRSKTRIITIVLVSVLGCVSLIYFGGLISQLLGNYHTWIQSGGMSGGARMESVSWNPIVCIPQAFTSSGLKAMLGFLLVSGGVFAYFKLHDRFDSKNYDPRGFKTSKNGIYGTAVWMNEKEMRDVLEITTPTAAKGTILGEYDGKTVCMPTNTKLNKHIAVFGASGTMKSRAIIRNALFQAIKRGESVVVTDPKGELYSDTSELFRQTGYEVKVFNLVTPEHGDSWNCMSDLNGDTLMAQVLTNVIIGNTSSGKGQHHHGKSEA